MAEQYTHEQLRHLTVAELREIAGGIAEVEHHKVVGLDKATVKAKIQPLKAERAVALEGGDAEALKIVHKKIRRPKRRIRKATV